MSDPSRYAELFLTESRDNLTAINQALLELERTPDAREQLDALFRAVHTLKGMSGVMGYEAVGNLAHDMEALLAQARAGERTLTPDVVALLFEATDALQSGVELSVTGKASQVNVESVRQRLREAMAGAHTEEYRVAAAPAVAPDAPPGDGLVVRVRLVTDAPLPGARAFLVLQRVATLGEVTGTAPDASKLREGTFGNAFAFRLRTEAGSDAIREVVRAAGYVDDVLVEHPNAESSAAPSAPTADILAAATSSAAQQRHVRVDLRRLDALLNLVGELVIARGRLAQVAGAHDDPLLDDVVQQAGRLIGELQDGILATRMVPVRQVFDRFPRVVRDTARALGKEVDLVVDGRDIELDRSVLEQIGDPLVHLLRNAIDHGIETPDQRSATGKARAARLVLSASRDRSGVVIRVTDDGRGIDRKAVLDRAYRLGMIDTDRTDLTDDELLRVIARPGLTTATEVTQLSGRGVGIDAVVTRIRALGGSVELRSVRGEGTTFTLRLPVTLAIISALLARVESETYLLPHLREVVGLPSRDAEGSQVVVMEVADRRAGLVVDLLAGQQEIVVKPFDSVKGGATCFSGATILGDGEPALIVEVGSLL
jgi:two-component system chemotaxis sensor kinase CheA